MFIAASLKNVVFALTETLILVLIVIFLFLGTLRATLIPAVTIPVSIIAAALVMATLDYSINTLTLLGAVLAIGLVVDDAIVVLENIVRRIEGGEPPVLASINGSREIGFAVIATTLVLMAVFVPVSFMTGDTGRLFGEFGVTVAAAVGFSAFVALSLTPMMASKLFANGMPKSRMVGGIDRVFHNLDERYAAGLRRAMEGRKPLWIVGGALGLFGVLVMVFIVGHPVPGTAPAERARAAGRPRHGADLHHGARRLEHPVPRPAAARGRAGRDGRGRERQRAPRAHALGRLRAQRRGEHRPRDGSAQHVGRARRERRRDHQPHSPAHAEHLRRARQREPDRAAPSTRNSTRPLAIAMGGGEYEEIVQWRDKVMQRVAAENPRILNLESDYLERQPRVIVQIDRNKAADLGVSLQTVGRTLETMMGSRIVTTFERAGEEYDVVLQARNDAARLRRRSRQPLRALRQERRPDSAVGAGAASTSAPGPRSCGARIACARSSSRARWRRATRSARRWRTWSR